MELLKELYGEMGWGRGEDVEHGINNISSSTLLNLCMTSSCILTNTIYDTHSNHLHRLGHHRLTLATSALLTQTALLHSATPN